MFITRGHMHAPVLCIHTGCTLYHFRMHSCIYMETGCHALLHTATSRALLQGFDVLFYGDSITMRWRDDWPANQWGVGPPPADTPGGTPMGVFNQTFRTNYTSEILGIGSEHSTRVQITGCGMPFMGDAQCWLLSSSDHVCHSRLHTPKYMNAERARMSGAK